jgi:hypothetical protein
MLMHLRLTTVAETRKDIIMDYALYACISVRMYGTHGLVTIQQKYYQSHSCPWAPSMLLTPSTYCTTRLLGQLVMGWQYITTVWYGMAVPMARVRVLQMQWMWERGSPPTLTIIFILFSVLYVLFIYYDVLLLDGMVWCGVVWSGLVWSGLVWSGTHHIHTSSYYYYLKQAWRMHSWIWVTLRLMRPYIHRQTTLMLVVDEKNWIINISQNGGNIIIILIVTTAQNNRVLLLSPPKTSRFIFLPHNAM